MLSQKKIEVVMEELERLQGHALNGQERLVIRTRISGVLAAKERHRQRISTGEFQWQKPKPPR